MKTFFLLLAACTLSAGKILAQTAPARPAPPATMAAPNTARSDMSTAAEGTGAVSTDYSTSKKQRMRDGQPKMKTTKMKGTMPDGSGKMKAKM